MPGPFRPANWPPAPFAPDSAISLPGQTELQNTATLAVTASTGRVPISLNGALQVEIYNAGPNDAFVCFGDVTVIATLPSTSTGSYPIGAGQCKVITFRADLVNSLTNMAAICASTQTATIWASPGYGAS
jgi:hypothetical protein